MEDKGSEIFTDIDKVFLTSRGLVDNVVEGLRREGAELNSLTMEDTGEARTPVVIVVVDTVVAVTEVSTETGC